MVKKARTFMSVASMLLLLACSDSTAPNALVGTYALATVDGLAIPVSFEEEWGSIQINSGSIVISSSNTFTFSVNLEMIVLGEADTFTETCTGSVTRSGNAVTLTVPVSNPHDCEPGPVTATWNGSDTLTISEDGQVLVFRK
jgi:hypothetical protein